MRWWNALAVPQHSERRTIRRKPGNKERGEIRDRIYREMCAEFGLPYPNGCAVHCTCGHDEKYEQWATTHTHAPRCVVARPNFAHFASGLEIRWYKYIGRGTESNRDVTRKEWRRIVSECEESIERERRAVSEGTPQ